MDELLDPMTNPVTYAAPFFILTIFIELGGAEVARPRRQRHRLRAQGRAHVDLDGRRLAVLPDRASRSPRSSATSRSSPTSRRGTCPPTPGGTGCCVIARARPRLLLAPPLLAPRAHRLGRPPGAPLQRVHELRHRAAAEVEPVVRVLLLAAAAAARLRAVDALRRVRRQPDLPVLRAHRDDRQDVAADRADLQHAVAPPRAPRQRSGVPRQELRRHPHHLGPHVRHVHRRSGSARRTA